MANGIKWIDTSRRPQLEKPFLAYVGYDNYAKFGDWLYKINDTSDRGYNRMYGYFRPDNFVKRALQVSREGRIMRGTLDQKVLRQLKDFQNNLLAQEKRLYKDLGCQDFFGFRNLWEGQTGISRQSNLENKRKQWLNYHISLLTGETQRLATGKDRTLIEQIFALVAIQLDKVNIQGIENSDGFGKKNLKNELLEADILEIPDKKVTLRATGKETNVYIPAKEHRKANEKDFIDIIKNFYAEKAGKDVSQILSEEIGRGFDEQMVYGLSQAQIKLDRKQKLLKTKTIDAGFISMNFKSKKNQNQVDAIANRIFKFMERARIFDLNNDELGIWNEDNKGGNMTKYLKAKIQELCQAYFANRDPLNINSTVESEVMGFFGELAAFAQGYFHLKNLETDKLKIDIFDIGSFRSVTSGQQLGSDTVLVVNKKPYGIQVKNPYQVTDNIYKTYEKTLSFDTEKTTKELQSFFGFNDSQLDLFEMYNLNINNTSNPEELKKQIQKFLLLYNGQFARLNGEQIRDDLSKYQNPVLESLQEKSINNVFFILKGTIYPSSYILQGLIDQYYYLLNDWEQYKKSSIAKKTLVFYYTNDIEKNLIENKEDEGKPFIEVGNKYIRTDIDNLLKKIKITSYLKLQIPSIAELEKLYKR